MMIAPNDPKGDGIADRDIALQPLHLVGSQAELADGGTCRSDDGRLGERARSDAGGKPLVEPEHARQHDNRNEAVDGKDDSHRDLAQRMTAERVEELGAAFETDGIDEQGKQNRFHAVVDRYADLAEQDGDQERSCDAAQLKFAELDFADGIAAGEGKKERDFRRLVKKFHEATASNPPTQSQLAIGDWRLAIERGSQMHG